MNINKHFAVKLIATVVFIAGTSSGCENKKPADFETIEVLTPQEILSPIEIENTKKAEEEVIVYLASAEIKAKQELINAREKELLGHDKNDKKKADETKLEIKKISSEVNGDPRVGVFFSTLNVLYEKSLLRLNQEIESAEKKFVDLSESQKSEIYKKRINPCFAMLDYIPTHVTSSAFSKLMTPAKMELISYAIKKSSYLQGRYNYTAEVNVDIEDGSEE